MPHPVLIFDFDGTVALGEGPVLAYANAVMRRAGLAPAFVDEIAQRLAHAESEGGAVDGYDLVRVRAEHVGVDADTLAGAYLDSRALLGTAAAAVVAPAGLVDLLEETTAERILLTNAPAVRLTETLAGLGLEGRFDRIVTDAGKPDGFDALLDEIGDRPVLSVGDIWRNDLAPAHARGHATALVGGFVDPAATPTYRAPRLEGLLDDLRHWVASASAVASGLAATATDHPSDIPAPTRLTPSKEKP